MFEPVPQRAHPSSSVSRLIRRTLLLLLSLSLPAGTLTAQSDKDAPVLEPGKPIERELAGGQSHSYRITLMSGQYLHVIVDQRSIDVVVAALFGSNGQQLVEADSPNGTKGASRFRWWRNLVEAIGWRFTHLRMWRLLDAMR